MVAEPTPQERGIVFAIPELELDALSLKIDADKMTRGNSESFYPNFLANLSP